MSHLTPTRHRTQGRLIAVLAALLLVTGLSGPGFPTLGATSAVAAACPCSVWPSTAIPVNPSDQDTSAVELGVKIRSDVAGFITGVRFYKGQGNSGTHTGSLWSTDGTRLASATFTNETATGWQQVTFSGPVAIAAATTYVASYYAPNGRYAGDSGAFANAGVDNAPLHALQNGVDGANGVYRYGTGGGYPANTFQSANYWVDVVFQTSVNDTTPPTVTARTPAPDSTGVVVGTAVSATFDEAVTGAQVALTGPSGPVAGAVSYDAPSRTLSLQPAIALATSTSYTATVSAATDASGNTMTPPVTWSFTTAATTSGCPCTLWPTSTTPALASAADSSAVELGVRFRSAAAGFVTGLRFYKGPNNAGTHIGSLWRADGTRLAAATFTGETAGGWQQVTLASPVAIASGTDYVVSYYAPGGGYAAENNGLSTLRSNPPLSAPASSSATPNGVYRYGASGFPSNTYLATNYWVDVVFDTTTQDRTPPSVTATSPADAAVGVDTGASVSATFDEAVSTPTVTLRLTAGGAVAGSTTYNSVSRTATFTPSAALSASTGYTASATASDTAGNAMTAPMSWSFTTASPAPPTSPPSGPVLVVAPPGAGFGRFLPEILRTEGLNGYTAADLSALTAATLGQYDVVVLGETALTAAQVTVLTDWVTAGGNLIAMRPSKQLSGLLGLTPVTSVPTTLAEGYLLVNTAAAPGAGITGQTMQYHGTADRYSLAGATSVATLYSGATTATTNPAVTMNNVGGSGGQAAAFTYDLARSVVYTRQGNPSFAGVERDGQSPIRSDDMFWGSTATNGYINLTKVAIPQADEQQRLLANLIQTMNRDRKPLPRFWYFPRMAKAVVVATGDDHGNNGTAGRYDQYEANSAPGCSVALWSCLRFSSYLYPSTPLPAAQASAYDAKGFETGVHPSSSCGNFTASSLESIYASQLSEWQTRFSGVPSPTTSRFHCIVYSDWASQPKTQLRYGMGMDTNYYYWPGSWVGNRPGFMTGSGMPMRFADLDGSVIDSYQAATQMTDESGQSYPLTPNTLLDNAIGTLGYYGAFTANVHTDQATTFESDQLLASARSRGVPVIAARQLLTWVKGRDASRFTGMSWSGSTLSFGITPGAGAEGLTTLLPTAGPSGVLTALASGGNPVPWTTQMVKGLQYAVFGAAAGNYTATYGSAASPTTTALRTQSTAGSTETLSSLATAPTAVADGVEGVYLRGPQRSDGAQAADAQRSTGLVGQGSTPDVLAPVVSGVQVQSLPDGTATVTWRTDDGADSRVGYGRAAEVLTESREDAALTTEHSVTLTDLEPGATYYLAVRSHDAAGNSGTARTERFVQSAAGVADSTAASLRVGAQDDSGYIASRTDGELQLKGEDQADFDVTTLPPGWTTEAERGGRTVVYGGQLRVDGTRALGRPAARPRPLEFSATFTGTGQYAGLAARVEGPWAMFTSRDGQLFASIHDGRAVKEQRLSDALVGSPHRYRVDWRADGVALFVDDGLVAEGALRGNAGMRPMMRDLVEDGAGLTVDWMRQAAFRPSSTYVSRVLDSQQQVTWDRASWQADTPAGTAVRVSVRTGSRKVPDATWSQWSGLSGSGSRVHAEGRYLQYRVELTTSSTLRTPVLRGIGFTHNGTLPRHEKETR